MSLFSPTVSLLPSGHVVFRPDGGDAPLPDVIAARIETAFHGGTAAGLFHLATAELTTPLPQPFAFWRDFSRLCLTHLLKMANVETPDEVPGRSEISATPLLKEELSRMVASAPPLLGLEYLHAAALENIWSSVERFVRNEAAKAHATIPDYLKKSNNLWNMVGRVVFHLAENRKNETRPFGFLVTYATRLSATARPQFLPLGRAFGEFTGSGNRHELLALLTPLQRAAEKSSVIRELVDSGEIFHPAAWTVRETRRFLDDLPHCESSGIVVRIPEAWRRLGRPPRTQVSITLGDRKPAGLGIGAMLDFSVELTLDGEKLTAEERKQILAETSGLMLLRGKWVEIDREKIASLLSFWERRSGGEGGEGISFSEGMRLMAGIGMDAKHGLPDPEASREWLRADAGEWLRPVLANLRSPDGIVPRDPGVDLKAELRPYQKLGLGWLAFMHDLGLGACLADDMGLGKTIQTLALLLTLRKQKYHDKPDTSSPALLIAPASLIANWKAEIARFAPSLQAFYLHPSETPSAALASLADADKRTAAFAACDLVVTTYAMAHRLAWLRDISWDFLILDEAQALKNPGARQTRAVKALQARWRLILTGTPLENRLGDLWSLFDFLSPGLLGSAKAFSSYTKEVKNDGRDNPYAALRALVRPYILRRLKTDRRIIADLPEKTEVRVFCPLTKKQAALYAESVREMAKKIEETEGMQRKGLVLSFLMRFKQICNHPSQWTGDQAYDPKGSGKFQRLGALCEEIASRQEKILVFTQFREMTAPLADFLSGVFGRPGLVLHGGTGVGKRRELVESFQSDNGPPFFVLSLKAGGVGLNLTEAAHVIHFDRWWNPAVENQATDRAFRIGQKKNVLVHKFVCHGTLEEKIDALIEDKKALAEDILGGSGDKLLTEMADEELLRFVSLDLARALDDEDISGRASISPARSQRTL